jgi:hypothetical protein
MTQHYLWLPSHSPYLLLLLAAPAASRSWLLPASGVVRLPASGCLPWLPYLLMSRNRTKQRMEEIPVEGAKAGSVPCCRRRVPKFWRPSTRTAATAVSFFFLSFALFPFVPTMAVRSPRLIYSRKVPISGSRTGRSPE